MAPNLISKQLFDLLLALGDVFPCFLVEHGDLPSRLEQLSLTLISELLQVSDLMVQILHCFVLMSPNLPQSVLASLEFLIELCKLEFGENLAFL